MCSAMHRPFSLPAVAAVSGNPWGCPPALCVRQGPLQQHTSARQASNVSSLPSALRASLAWQQQRRPCAAAAAPHSSSLMSSGAAPQDCARSVKANFAATDSFSYSLQPQLTPFPHLPDPQVQLLCDVMQLQPPQAEAILLSCPGVSTMTPAQLSANWHQLQQLLPVPQRMLLQAVLQVPSLLPQPQETVTARLAESARTLGVPAVQQLRARRREQTVQLQWRLLVTPAEQLAQQVEQLMQLLAGLSHQQVVRLVCAEPRLLGMDPSQLLSTVEALEQICGCPLGRLLPQLRREPRLLVAPAEGLYRAAAGMQQMLRLSEEGLTLVVRRAPAALLVPSERLTDLLTALPIALSVSQEVATDILLQEPGLLIRSSGAVLAILDVLKSGYKLNADALLQVVQFDPSALLLPAGQLALETKQFRLLAFSHPGWQAEYRYLMMKPVNVARALRIEPLRLQRLVFLSRQGLAGTISLRNALTLSGRKFVLIYPKYPAWLGHAYSRDNAPKRYAAVKGISSYEEDSEDDSDY